MTSRTQRVVEVVFADDSAATEVNGILGKLSFGAAAPTVGLHAHGEIVFNSAPASGGVPGWVCTTAGTPGTWRAFGVLASS